MVNWIGMISAAVVGSVVGGTIGYFFYLNKKAKDKKTIIEVIKNQDQQDFIIPMKDNDRKLVGKAINLKEYCGILPEEVNDDINNKDSEKDKERVNDAE